MIYGCVQVNMNKAHAALAHLTTYLDNSNLIALITEPVTAYNRICTIPAGYKSFPSSTLSVRPRAGIWIPSSLSALRVDHLSNEDCSVIIINQNSNPILIASIYLDRAPLEMPQWLYAISAFSEERGYPLLMALDANAHSEFYGSTTNRRGLRFEEFILSTGMMVDNVGSLPTFETFRGGEWLSSNVDVTLSRGVRVTNWKVDRNFNGSDHNSVMFNIDLEPNEAKEIRPWCKTRWKLFKTELSKRKFEIPEIMSPQKLDKMVEYLQKTLTEALDLACPKSVPVVKTTPDWFNSDLKKLHSKVKRCYRKAKLDRTVRSHDKYKHLSLKFKKNCKRARYKNWRDFVAGTKTENKMAKLYRILQHRDKLLIHTLDKPDGTQTLPGSDTLRELARVHFPNSSEILPAVVYDTSQNVPSAIIREKFIDYITQSLTKRSLLLFKPDKAPGPDGMKPIIFRHLPDNVFSFIEFLYKSCIHFRYTPYLWRLTNVVFLPKPGKDTYCSSKSFRPICLSDYLLKGLERLIVWRMDSHILNNPIHPKQHGFQKGKGTECAISDSVDYIESFIFRKKHCVGIFLDISSAYDSISITHVRDSLYRHGGDEDLVEWYFHYLSNRLISMTLHGESLTVHNATGFPQGGVASASFWLLAFNPAIEIINSDEIEGNGYADDCAALLGGDDPVELFPRLQTMLDRLVEWGQTCNLHFNPTKSIGVVFTRSRRTWDDILEINDQLVPFVDSVKYLGVTLDSHLYWKTHMLDKIKKGKGFLMKVANVTRQTWAPSPKLMRWAYRCIVRPKIIYASLAWGHAVKGVFIEKFRRINRLGMNSYAQFPCSTPTLTVELLTDTFPFQLYIQKEGLCAFIRLQDRLPLSWPGTYGNLRHNVSHRKFWKNLLLSFDMVDITSVPSDECLEGRPPSNIIFRVESFINNEPFLEHVDFNVYTDGSKSNTGVGSAFRILANETFWCENFFSLPSYSTVFQAEIEAINQASLRLQFIPQNALVKFYVDSQAAIKALASDFFKSKLVSETYANLLEIPSHNIQFVWVKAHSGVEHNEAVDQLAKRGAQLPADTHILPSRNFIRNKVLDKLREEWDTQWNNYPRARQSKIFVLHQDKIRAKEICNLSRRKLSRLIRVITGHNGLMYHRHNIENYIDPMCRFCEDGDMIETFSHLLIDCPAFAQHRQDLFQDRLIHLDMEWKVEELLAFSYIKRINAALTYNPNRINNPDMQEEQMSDEEVSEDDQVSLADEFIYESLTDTSNLSDEED